MRSKVSFLVRKIFYPGLAMLLLIGLLPVLGSPAQTRAEGETKVFNISAIDVVIMVNRFGDNDPLGKMFVLDENIPAVQARAALPLTNPDRVNISLRDDPIQPLVIRANVGDTVIVNFTNRLSSGSERASFHIQGLPVDVRTSAGSNVGLNPDTTIGRLETKTYTIKIPDKTNYEGSYIFNSMGNPRTQQVHGLFGVLNVEPRGSTYLNPITGQPQKSGWDAIIADPAGKDFREDTIIYHEFGDETFNLRDKNGNQLPQNVNLDGSKNYRPGSRLLNYRSEPFFRREALAEAITGHPDESQDYGSYMFGDPPTPTTRGYVGDPTKRRIVHAGSERFHMEHLHGGSIRWRFDPFLEPGQWGLPFSKAPVAQSLSTRLDSQGLGPGETYTALVEGAAGGLQAGAGEFLFHCHFPQHYIGGMWAFWRVFDTLQTANNGLFGNPALAELPDRAGQTPASVNSIGLLGRTMLNGKTLTTGNTTATTININDWIENWLPPQGVQVGYDASVWDWTVNSTPQGPLYLSEPETTLSWVNYTSPAPGQRLEIKFHPVNGRPAFPLLRPHLAKRPPFSPMRSGSPYLGEPDTPFSDNLSLIPAGARRIEYTVETMFTPITFNQEFNITNPEGALLVLDEDKADIVAGIKPKEQLTIRSAVGDGVDIIQYSSAEDFGRPGGGPFAFMKANIHIHFVQFDTQASDGVISGLSYEQSVRAYTTEGPADGPGGIPDGIKLTANVTAGSTNITVDAATTLPVNAFIGIGFGVPRRNRDGGNLGGTLNQNGGFEWAQITAKNGNTLTLDRPLANNHTTEQFVGTEFVRYQWFSDAESGSTYYHNHVFGIPGFGAALTGALIQEPVGSVWHPADNLTSNQLRAGTQAIITTPTAVAQDIPAQSFREFVLHFMAASTEIDSATSGEAGAVNLKAEPLDRRLILNNNPALLFSSVTHGDPETPILKSYVGDLVALRLYNTSGHDDTSFHLAGHRFRIERNDPREAPKDTITFGISERFDLFMTAGSVGLQAGDYTYMNGMQEKMMDGAWGTFRVFDNLQSNLPQIQTRFPLRTAGVDTFPQNAAGTGGAPPLAPQPQTVEQLKAKLELNGYQLPANMPVRTYNVTAIQSNIVFSPSLNIVNGRAYVLSEDEAAVLAGTKPLEPLVLRGNVGEIVRVNFTNHLPAARASFHVGQLIKLNDSLGSAFGLDNDSTVGANQTFTYWYVIDSRYEIPRSFIISDMADPVAGSLSGLYGVFVVEPAGSTYVDPVTGAPVQAGADVKVLSPSGNFRDVALLFMDDDHKMNRDVMPYKTDVQGIRGINYRAVPFEERTPVNADISKIFDSDVHGDPRTPVIRVPLGEQVRLHVTGGVGHQPHVFSLDGHRYPFEPARPNGVNFASRQFAPMATLDVVLDGGAGGALGLPGDYLFRDNRNPFLEAGTWGILRVAGPFPPRSLSGAVFSHNRVDVTWIDDSNNEDGFRIQRSRDNFATFIQVGATGANVTSFSDQTAPPASTLSYRVLAFNSDATSPSNVITVATPVVPSLGGGGGSSSGGGGGRISTLSVSGLAGIGPLVSATGVTLNAAQLSTTDSAVSVNIPTGTTMLTSASTPLNTLSVAPAVAPAQPPNGAVVVNFNFGPDGATFHPPLSITLTYSESQLPAGTNEADLYAAWWNGSAWVKLDSVVNAQANTITAQVSHFTNVAVIAPRPVTPPPPPPAPAPAPTPTPTPPPPPAQEAAKLTITSPAQGAILDAGDILVTIQVSGFEIVRPGENVPGKGHVHYYLDVNIPTAPGKPAVTAAGTYKAAPSASATWEKVSSGSHTLGVQLVNSDHTPLELPVTATVTVTVRALEVTPPPPAPAPGAPAPAGFNLMWVVIPLAAIIVIVLVIYFVRRAR